MHACPAYLSQPLLGCSIPERFTLVIGEGFAAHDASIFTMLSHFCNAKSIKAGLESWRTKTPSYVKKIVMGK